MIKSALTVHDEVQIKTARGNGREEVLNTERERDRQRTPNFQNKEIFQIDRLIHSFLQSSRR